MKNFFAKLIGLWLCLSFLMVCFGIWGVWTLIYGIIGGLIYIFLTA